MKNLPGCELFRSLSEDALAALRTSAWPRDVAKSASLFRQGDRPDHLFVVVKGRFKMTTVTANRIEKTLRFMEAGDPIGCAAVFRGFPYPATATAVIDSAVLSWTAGEFTDLAGQYSQLAANALALTGARAEEMLQRVREVTTEGAEQRIARAILRLYKQTRVVPGKDELAIHGQELAELSDTTLFTVSRAISEWKRDGILGGGRGRLAIKNLKRLRDIAENSAEIPR